MTTRKKDQEGYMGLENFARSPSYEERALGSGNLEEAYKTKEDEGCSSETLSSILGPLYILNPLEVIQLENRDDRRYTLCVE